MLTLVKRLARDTGGQDLIEYALLAATIAVFVASTAAALGLDVGSVYTRVGDVTRTAADRGDPTEPAGATPPDPGGVGGPGSGNPGGGNPGRGNPGRGNPGNGNPGNGKPVGNPGSNPGRGN